MSICNPILLAEDDESDAFLFKRALAKAGVSNPVVHVADGEEAISYLNGTGVYSDREKYPFPCLLVTDLNMPRLSGFDLLKRANALLESNGLPAIVLSASTAEWDKDRAFDLGAQAFFTKSPELAGLIAIATEIKDAWLMPAHQPV